MLGAQWNFCSNRNDYQSGSEQPHSIGSAIPERKNIPMPEQNANEAIEKDWPHAPPHRLDTNGVFMITAATLYKEYFFRTPEKLALLENTLLSLAKKYHWRLEAWAVFANHYHFVACGEEGALELDRMVKQLHDDTARELNRCDQTEGRAVWYNFWDTKLTYQRSYLARLLRAPESGQTWAGPSGESVSLVFRRLVRAHSSASNGQDDL